LAIIFYQTNNYYSGFLLTETQSVLFSLAVLYTFFGFIYHVVFPLEDTSSSKSVMILGVSKRVIKESMNYIQYFDRTPDHPLPKLHKHEKTALLFLLVKIFFLPVMINFMFGNYYALERYHNQLNGATVLTGYTFEMIIFPILFLLFFLIDSFIFAFGYCFEAGFLKNKVRSVEPTVLGWVVALICYPPFNNLFSQYVVFYPVNPLRITATSITVKFIILFFYWIYLWASIALGTKASNLTNRGIVSKGPYALVRHPAYISKNIAWWLTLVPIMSISVFLSMLVWSFVYYTRAITEEMHLIKDPDYRRYCKVVRYRFIPYVW